MAGSVAVLGTGTMGAGMVHSLLRAEMAVTVWNRSREKAEPLAADGAVVADTAAEAVAGADVVVTMLFDADSVRAVMADAAGSMRDDAVWLQASTVGPDATADLADFAAEHGLTMVDAPVLGTKQPAEKGELVMLVSGPAAAIDAAQPALDAMGSRTLRLGEQPGAASALKLVANAFIGTLTAAIGQSVALAEALDVDPHRFLEAMKGGASDSPYLQVKGAAILDDRTADAQFALNGVRKDLGLIRTAAADAGVRTSLIDGALEAYDQASAAGHGSEDMAAVVTAFRP